MPRGRLPETLRLSRSRLLMSGSALLWGLQFAFLTPSIGIILVALYSATPGEVGWALMLYNISGFISTLVVPSRADRQGDYLRPLLWCGGLTIALATALALVMSLPMAVLALVALSGPAGVGIGWRGGGPPSVCSASRSPTRPWRLPSRWRPRATPPARRPGCWLPWPRSGTCR